MVFRFLLRFLLSDKVINKLSESYPIRRAAKWVVYFAHKANAIKGDQKISLNQENLKNLQKLSERFINYWQQSVKTIKPESSSRPINTNSDTINKNETNNSMTNTGKTVRQDKDVEERMKNYIEELKKRTQQQ